jgi:N-acetyl-anhydromuramyl-L-alanine amidase AmpD
MPEIIEYGDFKTTGKQKKKKQIILCHTSREVGEYLASLKHRLNGKFDRIPNYVISREGTILKLLPDIGHTNFFKNDNVNRNGIIISLENLGWVDKEPLKDHYRNWISNIYKGPIIDKKWRDYFFWQPYTDVQYERLHFLCDKLCDEFKIEKKTIGHNTKFTGIEKFEGIVTKSNYDVIFTDVSPAFDFDKFNKLFDYGQT